MIIQSIRLKNIKSYAEGPDGHGVIVTFRPGINRVAGRNGHGKTTLIEALGYALFLCEPHFEERFALPTYFLRAGEKEGEIDVTFDQDGQVYRVERGIGQSRRRSKVVQLDDGSTCAEGDDAVSAWLCRLLASDRHRLAEQGQLSDLFSNLVGIKQGRLNRPFDCKPREAKDFFDPLLDVAIFGQCTSTLNDAAGQFKQLEQEQNLKLATIEERIRERADSLEKVPVKEAQLEALARLVEKGRKQKEEAAQLKVAFEQKQKTIQQAENALEAARNQLRLATQKRETDQHLCQESQDAATLVKRHQAAFQAYLGAETRLRELQQQQQEKSTLQQRRTEALNAKTEWAARKEFAAKQALDSKNQWETRRAQKQSLQNELQQNTKSLQDSKADFERLGSTTAAAQRCWESLERWLANTSTQLQQHERALSLIATDWKKIRHWNAGELLQARAEEKRLDLAVQKFSRKLAKAEQAKATLAAQLDQISGGVCPFLKEKCRQFDPKTIQSDLDQLQKEVVQITAEQLRAAKLHEASRTALTRLAAQEIEWTHLQKTLEEKIRAWIDQHNQFCPATLQKEAITLKSYLGPGFAGFPCWTEIVADDCRRDFRSWPGALPLRPLFEAQKEFASQARQSFDAASAQFGQLTDLFQKQRRERSHHERDLENAAKQLQQAEADLKMLAAKMAAAAKDELHAEAQVKAAATRLNELEHRFQAFARLDQEFAAQNQLKDRHADAHRAYLGAAPVAAKLDERSKQLQASSQAEAEAQKSLEEKTARHQAAAAGFEPSALDSARNQAAAAAAKCALDEKAWQSAQRELQEEQARFKQWKEACAAKNSVLDAIGRLQAAGQLAKLAAKVLKDTAPAVAQHLCSRISAGAQQIFNQINPEPIELEWKAEPQYSVRLSPGDRRFAMLSGGEQTKLALAMTLAMIEQFSDLRFAVFDEPTYGVDAESREKLADAIIASQKAARLDQLILVSHDNVFDGKIEHVVLLQKNAGTGTEIVTSA